MQAIIRKSGQPAAVKTFPNKAHAEIWARGVETDMDRRAWQALTLLKDKTVDDVIAAMHAQRDTGKGHQTAITTYPRIWVGLPSPASQRL